MPAVPRWFLGVLCLVPCSCDVVPVPHADDDWPPVPAARDPGDGRGEHHRQALALRARLVAGAVDVDTVAWFARRLGYLGDYDGAIAACSRGLERFPDDPRLLRHRGHRLISTRRFDAAVDDLARARDALDAAGRAEGDQVEPDGLPNAAGRPTGTLRTAVLYHLALARYLCGDHATAALDWEACLAASPSVDMDVAATAWLVACRRRLGDHDGARRAAAAIPADAVVLENGDYLRLCRLEAERFDADAAVAAADAPGASEALRYGVARYLIDHGLVADRSRLAELAATGAPEAFGTIAAAADLKGPREVAAR